MNEPLPLEAMKRSLIRRGLPPGYVCRLMGELADHLEDLSNETDASNQRIGDLERLESGAVEAFRSRSVLGRRPVFGFLLAPIPLAIAVWVGFYAVALLVGYAIFGPLEETPREEIAASGLILTVYYAGKIVPPAITAAILSWLAMRSGRPTRWLLSSIVLLSCFCFFGLSSQIQLPSPGSPKGTFSLGIPSWPASTQLLGQLIQALVPLLVGSIFMVSLRKAIRSFPDSAANSLVRCGPLGILFLATVVECSLLTLPASAQTIQTEDVRWVGRFGNRRPWQSIAWDEGRVDGGQSHMCDESCYDSVDGRRSVFGRVREFSAAWNSGDGDDLGITELDAALEFGANLFEGNLLVSPRFGMNWLTGPTSTDMPGQLYDLRLDVTWAAEVSDQFRYKLQVSPGTYTDFRGDTQSVRMVGSAIGYFDWTESLQLVVGATAFPEAEQGVTAIAGFVWAPFDDLMVEAVFPAPRISWRFHHHTQLESWVYLTGNVTRVSYNVERTTGADDAATYEARRLAVGVESRLANDVNLFAEGGFAFDRSLEFDSGVGDLIPSDQAFVRMGMRY